MDRKQLEALHERIIVQDEYPDDVCPTEEKLVEYVMGLIPATEHKMLEKHLDNCPECRILSNELHENSQWFSQNKSCVMAGIIDKAKDGKIEPWASCYSLDVLQGYFSDKIPDTDSGKLLTKQIEGHLRECEICRETAQEVEANLARSLVVNMADLAQKLDKAAQAIVSDILHAIKSIAATRGVGNIIYAMPGYRSQPVTSVLALILDKNGNMVLDDQGRPKKIKFDLIRGEVATDGHIIIDLSTTNRFLRENVNRIFKLSVVFQQENRKLILPSEKIQSDGRVTIVSNLISGIGIKVLPISTMIFTVIPAEENTDLEKYL
jgi:hypothetical protein